MNFSEKLSKQMQLKEGITAEKAMQIIQKEFLRKSKKADWYVDDNGQLHTGFVAAMSKMQYDRLRSMCQKVGIIVLSKWRSPLSNAYSFALKLI